jgi:hypothetical protein
MHGGTRRALGCCKLLACSNGMLRGGMHLRAGGDKVPGARPRREQERAARDPEPPPVRGAPQHRAGALAAFPQAWYHGLHSHSAAANVQTANTQNYTHK